MSFKARESIRKANLKRAITRRYFSRLINRYQSKRSPKRIRASIPKTYPLYHTSQNNTSNNHNPKATASKTHGQPPNNPNRNLPSNANPANPTYPTKSSKTNNSNTASNPISTTKTVDASPKCTSTEGTTHKCHKRTCMCWNMKRSKGITINKRVRMKNFRTISTTKTLASAITVLWTWTAWTSASICSDSARCLSVASSVWAEFTYEKSLTTC
jgi:hypothetical protein